MLINTRDGGAEGEILFQHVGITKPIRWFHRTIEFLFRWAGSWWEREIQVRSHLADWLLSVRLLSYGIAFRSRCLPATMYVVSKEANGSAVESPSSHLLLTTSIYFLRSSLPETVWNNEINRFKRQYIYWLMSETLKSFFEIDGCKRST